MPNAERPRALGWRLALALALASCAFSVLLHPPPQALWFDFPWIAYNLAPIPFSLDGMVEAIRWQASAYNPARTRPVRAVEWWLAVKALGCAPLAFYALNVLTLALALAAGAWLAAEVTGDRRRGALVAGCLALSYASVFYLLFFGYTPGVAAGFAGLAAWFHAERAAAPGRWRVAALGLLFAAALSHETFLAFAVVPLAHAALVRRAWPAVRGSLPALGLLPLYALLRAVEIWAYGTGQGILPVGAGSPRPALENPVRVLFELASGGLPLDPLRALPPIGEFLRIREWLLTPAGLALAVLAAAPGVALTVLGWRALGRAPKGGRHRLFLATWLVAGSVPLMLQVSAAEALHLTAVLPALFALWAAALIPAAGARAAWAALLLWAGVHGAARWVLFHEDVPAMGRVVRALQAVLAPAEAEGARPRVLFVPVQIGGHYGMLPAVPPLYPTRAGCARGEGQPGCLVESVWVWRASGRWPALPGACVDGDRVRVGPLTPDSERLAAGTRRMLAHWAATPHAQADARMLGACPLPYQLVVAEDGARYRVYPGGSETGARWYRFSFTPAPSVLPLAPCAVAPAGRG